MHSPNRESSRSAGGRQSFGPTGALTLKHHTRAPSARDRRGCVARPAHPDRATLCAACIVANAPVNEPFGLFDKGPIGDSSASFTGQILGEVRQKHVRRRVGTASGPRVGRVDRRSLSARGTSEPGLRPVRRDPSVERRRCRRRSRAELADNSPPQMQDLASGRQRPPGEVARRPGAADAARGRCARTSRNLGPSRESRNTDKPPGGSNAAIRSGGRGARRALSAALRRVPRSRCGDLGRSAARRRAKANQLRCVRPHLRSQVADRSGDAAR